MTHYQIEPLSEKNLAALVHLYRVVFGNKVTLDFVQRKFDTTYLGVSHFGHLAYYDQEPIAFHGAVPFRMQFENKVEISAQYGDAMTNPHHTGRGLFTELGHRTDQLLKEADIRFVWGFPNQNSEYGYVHKLDWQSKERIQGFKLRSSAKVASKLLNHFTDRFQKRFRQDLQPYYCSDVTGGSLSDEQDIVTTVRDLAFYRYKSFGGGFQVAINGVRYWLKVQSALLVGDIIAASKSEFEQSLDILRHLAARNHLGEIIIQSSPGTKISEWMASMADECFSSWMVGYKNFSSEFPLHHLKLCFGDLDTF